MSAPRGVGHYRLSDAIAGRPRKTRVRTGPWPMQATDKTRGPFWKTAKEQTSTTRCPDEKPEELRQDLLIRQGIYKARQSGKKQQKDKRHIAPEPCLVPGSGIGTKF